MTRQIIVEEAGRRNVQIVALEATVDHDVLRFPALFEKKWIFRKTSISVHGRHLETRRACACRKEAEDNKRANMPT